MSTDAIIGTITTGVYLSSDSYTNPVTIASGATVTAGGDAVAAGNSWTIQNYGFVSGGSVGVDLLDGGAVINGAAGSINGHNLGVDIAGQDGTVENAGAISGTALSVYLGASATNRLIVDAGAVFSGDVAAKAGGANTIELTSGASAGTLGGLGAHYRGFQSVTIDSGATWTVAGTIAGFGGTTIAGFGTHDRLDLTDLSPAAGDSVTLNGSDVLTIRDSGGDVLGSVQLSGDFTGDFFHLLDDDHGGTFIEDDETPCFCRGTRIRTPDGEVAVEDLKIGDRLVTAGGEVLPLKWIGRRSYRDWLAVGNPKAQPICFKAGSIADRVPVRDLLVSPQHAMYLDGMLIPARLLVNGISILKLEGVEAIDYLHLELDRHAVILAEGAAAESFADDNSRCSFHNAHEYRRRYPNDPRGGQIRYCAPRVEDGYALEVLRRALTARAERLRPNRTAAPAPVQRGYLDRATRTAVEGWASPGAGGTPVVLAIVVNGAVVGQTVANLYRSDLVSAGAGDGHCSFRFALPQGLSPEVSHRIEVRRESDWSLLHGGPVTLKPSREAIPMPAPYSYNMPVERARARA